VETLINLDAIFQQITRCECGSWLPCGDLYRHALDCREVSSAFKSRAKLARANFDLNPDEVTPVLTGLVERLTNRGFAVRTPLFARIRASHEVGPKSSWATNPGLTIQPPDAPVARPRIFVGLHRGPIKPRRFSESGDKGGCRDNTTFGCGSSPADEV
jgi:hypothetical protein